MENLVIVENLSFTYGSNIILDNLSFSIREGEIVGLLGENGVGKTTLLDCIYGMHGKMNGIRVLSNTPFLDSVNIKENVSYVQDSPNLLDYLTAKQYLSFMCNIEKVNFQEKKKEIFNLLDEYDLKNDYEIKLLKDYSFGMKKKIQLIGELIMHKKLLIIDEPTNGLDVKMVILLKRKIIQENKNRAITILVSSHNTSFLKDVCDRVLLLTVDKKVKNIIINDTMNLEDEFLKISEDHMVQL